MIDCVYGGQNGFVAQKGGRNEVHTWLERPQSHYVLSGHSLVRNLIRKK